MSVEATVETELTPEQQEARAKLLQHVRTGDEIDSEHVKTIIDDIIAQGTNLKEEAPSPTALRLDKWDMRRGKEISETNEKLKKAEIDELEAADFHAAAFHPEPALHNKCTDSMRTDYLKQMMETLEYQELHDQTAGDDFASELAAAHFGSSYAKLREQKKDIDQKNAERSAKGQPPLSGSAGKPNIIGAVASALGGAQAAVEEYADACDAMGWGTGPGSSNGKLDPSRIAGMMSRINKSQNLKRIIEWAGRFKIVASSCQREKITMGNDEIVGVVPGNALERMLPQEFTYLDDPDLEVLFFQKYLERKAMCREFRAHENLGRGPIVVIIDESGSMSGQRIETAKGMMLAIGWIARKQKRWLTLAAFCGGTQSRIETFPTGNWDERKMMDWIEKFMGGGTELYVPFQVVPEYLDKLPGCPKGKIDFIVITDGDVGCPEDLKQNFLKWKAANKCRLLSIIINSAPGILSAVSDEVYMVNAFTLDCAAARAAFSI